MKSITLRQLTLFLGLSILISACGSTVEQSSTLALEASAMGPFFAGPNSLMADYTVDCKSLYPESEVSSEQIKAVHMEKVSVKLIGEDVDASHFASASLQFVSDSEEMVSVAILNPISVSGNSIELQTSQEADLAPFFKGEAMTCVLDLDFNDDDYRDELSAQLTMTLKTTLKQ